MTLLAIALLAWSGAFHPEAPRASVAATPLAVLDFDNNSGDARYDPLGKGIAAMMVTDLAGVPALQLVERSRLQDLIDEMDLQQTRHFDPATAQSVGRMVGAEYVVIGSIVALSPQIRLDTRIVRVATGEVVKTAQVTGRENRLFELQQKLADELLAGIEVSLSPEERERLRARQEANRIEELETMLAFSEALSYLDREDYVRGAEKMFAVTRMAPNSLVVKLAYEEARTRTAESARDRARDAAGRLLRRRIPR
jgi:TolB-like protein